LLAIVATELAVFLRGDGIGGAELFSLSLLEEFRDSQEKGLVSFRVGGGGLGVDCGTGGAGLFKGDSMGGEGAHEAEGNALLTLPIDAVLPGCSLCMELL
jgi:hypothetical protein